MTLSSVALSSTQSGFSYQRSIVPLIATDIHYIPEAERTSANLKCIVTADNGRDYAVKEITNSTKGYIPACELFCYELARAIKVNVPEYHIIEMKDGTFAFGSEWDGNAHFLDQFVDFLRILTGKDALKNGDEFFSKVYALDIFVNNIDRHHGNLFVRKTFSGQIGFAFDFDRSWYEKGYDQFEAIIGGTNTQDFRGHVQEKRKFKKLIVKSTLDQIGMIQTDQIKSILDMMPEAWIQQSEKDKFVQWWGSDELNLRVNKLKNDGV